MSKQYKPDGLPNFKLRDLEKVKTFTNLADIKYEKNLHHFVFFFVRIFRTEVKFSWHSSKIRLSSAREEKSV